MIVGIPQECKNNEYRVSLMPQHIAAIAQTHKVIVQQDAGLGAGFSNEDYIRSGGIMVSSLEDVYAQANLIIKVKEPLPQEYALIKPHHTLFTFFHFAASSVLTEAMLKSGATCIAYETIEDSKGGLPLLAPMSEVAGRLAGQQAAKYLEKPQGGSGILVGGVTGVAPGKALVLGGGVVGTNAAAVLVGMGAAVTICDINENRLTALERIFDGNIQTLLATEENILATLPLMDAVIGAVLVKGAKAPKLITREMLSLLRPYSVLVDVAVDQGGCFETTKPTTHEHPTYYVDDILHYAVANMPGAVPRTSTQALSSKTFPYIMKLLNKSLDQLPAAILKGVNTHRGKLTNREVAAAFKLPYSNVSTILG
ncbi:MAG: alanine dehydrogenase [Flavobacteriaceae bacterium]|jgi:alanine dehydrogenase|tara:strand:+ start:246 stop:1349 length:1104 start_codon:yes stop_codon:yes gene_type:complete